MNFIIYDDDVNNDIYKSAIFRVMSETKLNYRTINIEDNNSNKNSIINKKCGNNIYIINNEKLKEGNYRFIEEIRNSGDWLSPIIIVYSGSLKNVKSKIAALDYVKKDDNFENRMVNSISLALDIISKRPALCFSIDREMFRIPYHEILYIEKLLNDNFSIVHTKKDKYPIRKSISSLEKELADFSLFKTHRSCIVNIRNVTHVDFDKGIIFFDEKSVDLLSRSRKKLFKKAMNVI